MNPADDLEKRIKRIRVTTTDVLDRRILADAWVSLENPRFTRLDARRSGLWRIVMRNHWMKLAAGFLLVLTAILGTITFLGPTAPAAYALEQTLEANQALRYIHIRIEPAGEGLSEAWAQFDEDGELLRLRMIFPKTIDGAKEVLWQEDKAEVWFKTKGHAVVLHEKEMLQRMPEMLKMFDPRVITEELQRARADEKVRVETQEPSQEGEPITLVASPADSPDRRGVFQINPQTKLVEQHDVQRLTDGQWKSRSRREYLEYNQEVPPGTFVLDIPADVTRIDQTTKEVGLPKGDLTDDEIAVKVAREFFEALIAKDYGRAGALFGGMPASRMEQMFGRMEFLRILSVGDPTPHPDARTRFLQVPCEVELRMGDQTQVETFMPDIRAVHNQPDRWGIGGGI